ncbi:MAG: aminotransferase class III-fold pyridoxal phosphate-dependent enzyme [Coriobacteriales bacterium]|jgi:acetylornithine aminotransferase|nr:aminotransferase class III-fold pyridoxal phosphate-dependent enzyme [Coriobacteriales bacterium]
MGLQSQQQLERDSVMQTYGRKPVMFVRGEGMRLYDDEGRRYLDFLAGVGAVSVGHANTRVAQALSEQAARLVHVGNYFYVEGRGELAGRLGQLLSGPAGMGPSWKLFFANSGAEAVEGAIKIARKHGTQNLDGAFAVVSARKSFHGRTLAALAATGQAAKQDAFGPMPQGFVHVPLNDVEALRAALDARGEGAPCAVLLEGIQGEGGVWPCEPEYLAAARAMTAERGMLLMCDEVQTGFYRTGTHPFSYQHHGVVPDVVTLAKGIANGMPMGAVAACGDAAELLCPGEHGSTFGGSPLAVAAAHATLDELEARDVASSVTRVGACLAEALQQCALVTEVRGRGLMLAAQLAVPVAQEAADAALAAGLVVNAIGDSILRLLPPLICTEADVDEALEILDGVLTRKAGE